MALEIDARGQFEQIEAERETAHDEEAVDPEIDSEAAEAAEQMSTTAPARRALLAAR